ncbi:hypothetical protein [Deinococcus yavapaiensis]|uniref:Uncharacterized protein n=1 Tax=Deinococcus yavapaiensis KR-236 TaxID=694435 RepID=A0A318SDL2_9DEIO|nr:hypothetical protein [Deinococcus yavapaiensis]PYE54981.1 hypothetical protein DES52_104255 [Deinococcus yavapaiensis KR-236]
MSAPQHKTNSVAKPVLPPRLYPTAFWIVVTLLALGLFVPALEQIGVLALLLTPVVAAVTVVLVHWRDDRRLAVAALLALVGLALVYLVRGYLPALAKLLGG